MADFTTWAALKTAILNDLSNGSVLTQSYSIEGRSRRFHSLMDVKDFLMLCDIMTMAADAEDRKFTHVQFERPSSGVS